MYETILLEQSNGVSTIALNRPDKLNSFNSVLHEEILDALNGAAADDDVRCIVLRGEGRGFSAGADLAEVIEGDPNGPDLGEYLRRTYSRLVTRMVTIEKTIVAALHGPVYGAGLGMSMLSEAVDAEEAYRIGLVNRLVPDERLEEEVAEYAGRLAGLPTMAMGRIKQTFYKSFESDLAAALESEAESQSLCGYTQDHKEGVAAFMEKREAHFTGR